MNTARERGRLNAGVEVTPIEGAKALGVSRLYFYGLLAEGQIKGRKVLGRWLVLRSSIDEYRRRHPRRVGTPREALTELSAEAG